MKIRSFHGALCTVFIPLLALMLLSALSVGCGRKDHPQGPSKKDEQKAVEKTEETDIVTLSPEQVRVAGIETKKAATGSFAVPLLATAIIEPNGNKVSRIGSRVAGRITKVVAIQGDRVKTGQPLAYLESIELDQAWSDYAKARGKHALAATNLRREETLFEKKVAPEKDALKARQEFKEAEADLGLCVRRLRLLGVERVKPEDPSDGPGDNHPFVVIPSPLYGVVIERTVTQGEMVSPDKVLFTVSDISSLWVVIDIYEKDMGRIRTGMEVKLLVAAYPDAPFKGHISYIGDVMDEKTRTVKARVTVDNSKGLLKPGMFATVSIDTLKRAPEEKLRAIPEEAILMEGPGRYVFIAEGAHRFKKRVVTPGRTLGKVVEITNGLKEGDEVVVKGAFILKSELNKKSLTEE